MVQECDEHLESDPLSFFTVPLTTSQQLIRFYWLELCQGQEPAVETKRMETFQVQELLVPFLNDQMPLSH
jgi:hypothetical protein